MMKFLNKFIIYKEGHIGLDIGSYAVKAVELSRAEKNNFKINNAGYARIENPASRESRIRAIKAATGKLNIVGKEVNIAVSGPSVIVRFIELPHMTADELRNAVPFEAEKYIPFSINEVNISHQLLIPRLGNNMMLVLLVATKKDLITERLGLINELGLSARILDITSFANVNAFLSNTGRKKGEIAALIDIGAKAMDINIIDENILYFTRSVQMGGEDLTKILSEALSTDLKSAEDIKINPADKGDLVREKIEPVLRNMIDETRLSFSYYENQSGKAIGRVYLTGGGSGITNFPSMLKENLGIDVVLWDPTEFIEIDASVDTQLLDSIKDQLGVAIGLALR